MVVKPGNRGMVEKTYKRSACSADYGNCDSVSCTMPTSMLTKKVFMLSAIGLAHRNKKGGIMGAQFGSLWNLLDTEIK